MATSVTSILERIAAAGKTYEGNEIGSRELLIELGRDLVATLEIPSEFLQRSFWAEPALSAHCKFAVQVKLFQHLQDAGSAGVNPSDLAKKTGVDVVLLQRIMRHLIAMKVVSFSNGRFLGTPLSHGLAADNYQKSIDFCYDVARPSFNGFPEFFKKTEYKLPTSLTEGPFQTAHGTELPFFPWLVTTPPHLDEFDAFMSAYRAGKANWFDQGFYPVAERLVGGFDGSNNEAFLVDVGGGRGHDAQQFVAQHASHPGKVILQDREPVIASIQDKRKLPFESQVHDFFTPQPIKAARAYFLHSIIHDWDDENGIRILENLKLALKPGYSRLLLNEIVLSEEKPTIAATSMDMMMLAHMAVRERTEAEWKGILEKAGLKFLKIYNYPGVAESVIEAELEA
ncbi:putative hydroxyindole O-methyltransferase [Clathrospora elynae]|uniref:Putative hydroxyindole O-methyltransferase n=1 Tax=Clathrospora elynae TaxID=706981 RepID=A0A6A5T741_9PLEO|nr:putative hydroxyindole O-methyltransferase [Clathrospora elynae]